MVGYRFFVLCFLLIGVVNLYAQDLSYPELLVAPRASERLQMEAQKEQNNKLLYHLPIQASSALTVVAGALHFTNIDSDKDPDKKSPLVGLAVGGAWIGATILLGQQYHAYTRALKHINTLSVKNQREMLIRERIAEEEIRRIGNLGRKMAWASVFSNLFASSYMLTTAGNKTNFQGASNILAMIGSFAPLLFQNPWADVANEQESYKKKIYGKLAFSPLATDYWQNKIVPGVTVGLSF